MDRWVEVECRRRCEWLAPKPLQPGGLGILGPQGRGRINPSACAGVYERAGGCAASAAGCSRWCSNRSAVQQQCRCGWMDDARKRGATILVFSRPESRGKRQEARGKRQEARGKRQEVRGERQESEGQHHGLGEESVRQTGSAPPPLLSLSSMIRPRSSAIRHPPSPLASLFVEYNSQSPSSHRDTCR
jgi:hypothetical protein